MSRPYLIALSIIGLNAFIFTAVWFLIQPVTDTIAPPETVSEVVTEGDLLPLYQRYAVIGTSVEGRAIESNSFGTGPQHLLFVGGMHGGYEWNSVLLAYRAIDYLAENPTLVPEAVTITIIPNLNPDGTFLITGRDGRFTFADVAPSKGSSTGTGRFNANAVDLNRNFNCRWQAESTWRGEAVSAGTAPFSEPEAAALRDFVAQHTPAAVVFWHSQGNAVYASECEAGILPRTHSLMQTYATAASYQAIPAFDAYPITGDAEGWLASINIPAITVELATHETTEWEKNLAGIMAVITAYAIE